MDAAPIFIGEGDIDAARALVTGADEAELFFYLGDQHCFVEQLTALLRRAGVGAPDPAQLGFLTAR